MVKQAPFTSRYAPVGAVSAVDHLAAEAGVGALRAGGTAADAALATAAVLAVTCQHMCGMGGDLVAVVHVGGRESPVALNASGRAGSGADPEWLRARGYREMPTSAEIRGVPVPGCVDGWVALHERYGRLDMAEILAPARRYAMDGFPASPLLVRAASSVSNVRGGSDFGAATHPGALVRRPGVARALAAIAVEGRDGFYQGEFGEGLLALGGGEYSADDLKRPNADWVVPLGLDVWGHRIWTVPPNSQGYLTLAGAWIAERVGLPPDPDDPLWAHLTVEAARQAAFDRLDVLHEGAEGDQLISEGRLAPRAGAVRRDRAALLGGSYRAGGTVHVCAVDHQRMAVSLTQSNAAGFGIGIAEPNTGIFLHNRGIGFSLVAGHPAEYRPRRRPPHTLSPALVTGGDGSLKMVLGTMGGDSQPQILLQTLARMLQAGEGAGDAIAAPRWVLEHSAGEGLFSTWAEHGQVDVCVEPGAPQEWERGLRARGHAARVAPGNYGHAHVIACHGDHLEGASDPRSLAGAVVGY